MNFKEYISLQEMPIMSLRGKTAYAGDAPLKSMTLEGVSKNIVFIRQPEDGFFPKGYTIIYFMDSEESAQAMARGELPYLTVPRASLAMRFQSRTDPITAVWSKKMQKPGTEHILGLIEGNTSEETIYIDMITVRNKWQRNHIASLMIAMMKEHFPKAEVTYSRPTEKGKKLFRSMPEAEPEKKASEPSIKIT